MITVIFLPTLDSLWGVVLLWTRGRWTIGSSGLTRRLRKQSPRRHVHSTFHHVLTNFCSLLFASPIRIFCWPSCTFSFNYSYSWDLCWVFILLFLPFYCFNIFNQNYSVIIFTVVVNQLMADKDWLFYTDSSSRRWVNYLFEYFDYYLLLA